MMVKKFKSIKLISFDLDGTLIDKKSFDDIFWLEEVPKIYAKKHKIKIQEAKKIVIGKFMENPKFGVNWYRPRYWFKYFKLEQDHETILNDLKGNLLVYEDVVPLLKELKSKGFKLIVITHSTRDMIKIKLEVENLLDYFDEIHSTTDDYEMIKKDEKIFNLILKKHQIKAKEMLHIGDHKDFDFYVPKMVGVNALFLDRKKTYKKDNLTINSLKHVIDFL